jgi:SAM-dependent methyltransferase
MDLAKAIVSPAVRQFWARREANTTPVWSELVARLEERLHEATVDFSHVLRFNTLEDFLAFMPDDTRYDAVLCPLWLGVTENVPETMATLLSVLRPGGLFLASALGPNSFREFRIAWAEAGGEPHARGHVTPLADGAEWAALLHKAKLESPVVDVDHMTVTFDAFPSLYRAFRQHGAGNVHPDRVRGLTGKALWARMEETYRTLFAREDSRLPVSLEVVYLHGFRAVKQKIFISMNGNY